MVDIIDVIVHVRYSIEPFLYSGRGDFVVIIEVHGVWIKGTETSIREKFAGSDGCRVVGKFRER